MFNTACSPRKAFQSSLPRGSDASSSIAFSASSLFQSSLPRGSYYTPARPAQRLPDFNPRSLAGATILRHVQLNACRISIHAPLRERPEVYANLKAGWDISIHAPSRERPKALDVSELWLMDFNPRSLAGATCL